MVNYVESLALRLAGGFAAIAPEVRQRHAAYLESAQRKDGGFAGREGESDLYYTGFALRSLGMLGRLSGRVAERAGEFLRRRRQPQQPTIDLLSLAYGAAMLDAAEGVPSDASLDSPWRREAGQWLERLRRDDGGYAKSPRGGAGSTYHTFLALLCHQLWELPTPQPQRVLQFIASQRGEDGGFREIRVSKRSGTNPTAAAVGVLRILDAVGQEPRKGAVEFLAGMQNEEGGFRANTQVPVADLLSTFTALLTLADLQALDDVNADAARRYVRSLERRDGGFQGAVWDRQRDVEYTFYGLGALALLGGKAS